eukprot:CAMPEP_0181041576 /NCGR_PEP_ID=MMETSP1070-20121207/11673_1 /TAXON_ID=265543 /ORGANISM="Minutocellus polymorphus, Strain NH13" /LENGTH=191 /DNA_ID=CAMNT_0023119697 /DNA_START=60 /DNA_END=635 /DNA_ORIENTATION=-
MTLPTSASSSSSLHLLPSRSPLTVEASSAKPDILPFVLQAVMTDPIIAGMVTSTHQQDAGFEASPRRTKRPRQVRFDNKISGKKLAPFAAEVRSSMYYNKQELDNMHRNLMEEVRQMRRSDQSVCKRGIEHMASPEILRGMRQEKEGVIQSVLSEQKRQRMMDIHDPQHIALISSEYSAGAKMVAQWLASR